jgi:hypothetical protein
MRVQVYRRTPAGGVSHQRGWRSPVGRGVSHLRPGTQRSCFEAICHGVRPAQSCRHWRLCDADGLDHSALQRGCWQRRGLVDRWSPLDTFVSARVSWRRQQWTHDTDVRERWRARRDHAERRGASRELDTGARARHQRASSTRQRTLHSVAASRRLAPARADAASSPCVPRAASARTRAEVNGDALAVAVAPGRGSRKGHAVSELFLPRNATISRTRVDVCAVSNLANLTLNGQSGQIQSGCFSGESTNLRVVVSNSRWALTESLSDV